ncbi:MAG: hypothetical protein J6S91_02215, partial [Treponema sp.]|nr:hypothetical protein [Treponema sp.]
MKKILPLLSLFFSAVLIVSCTKGQASTVADTLSQEVPIADQETIDSLESKISELENTLSSIKESEETQVTKISYEDSYIRITEPKDGAEKY